MTPGARRCTQTEAYELAYAMHREQQAMGVRRGGSDERSTECVQTFGSLEELVEYLGQPVVEQPKKRWWEFWK